MKKVLILILVILGLIFYYSSDSPNHLVMRDRFENHYDTIYEYDGTYVDITNKIRAKFNKLPIENNEITVYKRRK